VVDEVGALEGVAVQLPALLVAPHDTRPPRRQPGGSWNGKQGRL